MLCLFSNIINKNRIFLILHYRHFFLLAQSVKIPFVLCSETAERKMGPRNKADGKKTKRSFVFLCLSLSFFVFLCLSLSFFVFLCLSLFFFAFSFSHFHFFLKIFNKKIKKNLNLQIVS
jgi:hypothetical protein